MSIPFEDLPKEEQEELTKEDPSVVQKRREVEKKIEALAQKLRYDDKDQTIATLRAELDLAEKAHVYVNDEWHKVEKRLEEAERQLARYREGFPAVKECLDDCEETLRYVRHYVENRGLSAEKDVDGSLQLIQKAQGALKAVEGEDSPKVTEGVTMEE